MKRSIVFMCAVLSGMILSAQEVKLPKPVLKGGKSLMECMSQRKTARQFANKPLPPQMLSEILYAADGINRADGRKTVPTARNVQNQSVYVLKADGAWLYQPKTHSLKLIAKGDLRGLGGKQPFHKNAGAVLIYVSEITKVGANKFEQTLYTGSHAGFSSQNVYLYAADKGLSTVVCGMVDRNALKGVLKLKPNQIVIFSQPVGFAK